MSYPDAYSSIPLMSEDELLEIDSFVTSIDGKLDNILDNTANIQDDIVNKVSELESRIAENQYSIKYPVKSVIKVE